MYSGGGKITTLGSMTRFAGLGYTFSVSNWCTPERRVLQPITVPRTPTGRMSSTVARPRLPHTAISGVHSLMSASTPLVFTSYVGHTVGLCNVPDTCLPPAMRLDNWLGPIQRLLVVSFLSHWRSLVACCGLLMKGGSTFQFRNPHAKSHLGPSPTEP